MRRLAAGFALLVAVAGPSAGMDVRPLGLDEVVDRADCIVHATVSSVASGRDADGIPATWITLAVAECLKGGVGSSLVVKQVGVQEPLADGTLLRVPGLPRYHPGDELVLFLHAPSGRGFTSPIGMGQGCYRISRSDRGRVVRALATTDGPGEATLPDFLERVRRRVAR